MAAPPCQTNRRIGVQFNSCAIRLPPVDRTHAPTISISQWPQGANAEPVSCSAPYRNNPQSQATPASIPQWHISINSSTEFKHRSIVGPRKPYIRGCSYHPYHSHSQRGGVRNVLGPHAGSGGGCASEASAHLGRSGAMPVLQWLAAVEDWLSCRARKRIPATGDGSRGARGGAFEIWAGHYHSGRWETSAAAREPIAR